jgi:tRNA U34 2-thiouridine synthase MnmA/TrmU
VTNRITIAPRAALDVRNIALVEAATPEGLITSGAQVQGLARIRHRGALAQGTVTGLGGGAATLALSDPLWAPSPGQTVVLYDGETLVAGARIARPQPSA